MTDEVTTPAIEIRAGSETAGIWLEFEEIGAALKALPSFVEIATALSGAWLSEDRPFDIYVVCPSDPLLERSLQQEIDRCIDDARIKALLQPESRHLAALLSTRKDA